MRLSILKIKREERSVAVTVVVLMVALHAVLLCHYWDLFTPLKRFYWPLFIHKFHVSGFDPITYSAISDWDAGFYNVFRHPLLEFFVYPLYLLNSGLMWLTGINCAMPIIAVVQTIVTLYGCLFMHRTLREVVGLGVADSTLCTLLLYGMGYVMLSCIVPDHFGLSMMLLLLTLYITGRRMKEHRLLSTWEGLLLFVLTAGVSLNNGLKTFMAGLLANGRRFFHWHYLLGACVVPALLMWYGARREYTYIVHPVEVAQKEAKKKAAAQRKAREAREKAHKDSVAMAAMTETVKADAAAATAAKDSNKVKTTPKKKKRRQVQGTPLSKGEFMRWTDISTDRWQVAVHSLMGEGVQLHSEHRLEDVMRQRPVIVSYTHWWQYGVEALVVVLWLMGMWAGRRQRVLWLATGWFALDMTLHMGLGFGINEVYIMSAHWMFIIPLAVACLLRSATRWRTPLRIVIALLTLWLWGWNAAQFVVYLN